MNHSAGGPATDRLDAFQALEDQGNAARVDACNGECHRPNVLAAGWPATRSRPPCAHPTRARLKTGATNTEDAASFECR